jgi:hypothetical protein
MVGLHGYEVEAINLNVKGRTALVTGATGGIRPSITAGVFTMNCSCVQATRCSPQEGCGTHRGSGRSALCARPR